MYRMHYNHKHKKFKEEIKMSRENRRHPYHWALPILPSYYDKDGYPVPPLIRKCDTRGYSVKGIKKSKRHL